MRKILCIGDSNTFGYDPRSYLGGRYPEHIRWTGRIRSVEREIVNAGQNGLCIPGTQAYALYADLIRKTGPDLVIVMLGSNDLLNGYSAGTAAVKMDRFLGGIRSRENHPAALLISPPRFQPGDWVADREMIEESRCLGDLYRDVAEKNNLYFADSAGWGIDILFDGVHFSEEGHRVFAEELLRVLQKLPQAV